MRGKTVPIGLMATLAIFAAILFVTSTGAAAEEKVLHSFNSNGTDGIHPQAGLIFDAAGNLYGTTSQGGSSSAGMVFELTPAGGGTWTEKVLYSFHGGADGSSPRAGLIFDAAGNLYGTTYNGGTTFAGTVFELTPTGGGTWTEKVLLSFGNDVDGSNPQGELIFDGAGNLYATTKNGGGPNDAGTVFELTPGAGGTWTEKVLWSFGTGTDGSDPFGALIFDAAGNLYGTTSLGGTSHSGTAFELTPAGGGNWTESVAHSFGNGTDGAAPAAGLLLDGAGNLYGTTYLGGSYGGGTVFRLNAQGLVLLYSFSGTDGANPAAGLLLDAAGNFYGTTYSGGSFASYGTVFETTSAPPVPYQFVTVTPCRLVDTRPDHGGSGPILGGTFRTFPIPQEGGCNIPATAAAYSLNVSVVPLGGLGYLTMWPAGVTLRPLVSTLNSVDGRIKASAAIVPAGTNGAVNIYVTNTTNVILDINGYFAAVSSSTLAFYPLTPCRVADTRHSTYPPGLGPPYLTGNQERDFPILNATSCNIPASAAAYSLNFSVVPHGPLGYMTVWPTGQSRPVVSTLNDLPAQTIANAALVPVGASGKVSVYPSNDTDLIIDINGYFAPAGTGGLSLYAVAPCRVIDTRHVGSGQPFSGTLNPPVDVEGSVCGPSATAQAYVFNASVVPQGMLGYLTLWPDGATQ